MPDIKNVWPNVQVTTILIGQQTPINHLDTLIQKITDVCGYDCLLITSVDFSHYLPANMAFVHDRYTLKQLNNLDSQNIQKAEVDSPQSLYLATRVASAKNAILWNLFAHTNSGYLSNNFQIETTTHIFGSYQRTFRKIVPDTSTTFTKSSTNMDKKSNIDTLGERFFYGTQNFNFDDPSQPMPDSVIVGFNDHQQTTSFRYYFIHSASNSATLFYDQKRPSLRQSN